MATLTSVLTVNTDAWFAAKTKEFKEAGRVHDAFVCDSLRQAYKRDVQAGLPKPTKTTAAQPVQEAAHA